MHKFNKSVLALALACATASVLADETAGSMTTAPDSAAAIATAPPMAPNLSQIFAASNVMVMGYLDAGYTNMDSTGLFTNGSASRVFDAPGAAAGHNFSAFNLNQAALTVAMQPKQGFGALVNVIAGQDASTIASYGEGAGSQHNFDLTQAFASYATGPLTVIAGKFVTLAGAEVIARPSDTSYSRSILFGYAIPFTHTGVRATYAVSDTVSLMAGINNGWDQVSSLNGDQTVELGFTATPIKMLALSGVYYGGNELTTTPFPTTALGGPGGTAGANGMRNLYDFVATLTATSQLSFVVNYDYANQANATLPNGSIGTATWDGVAGYINYQFNDQWRLSARAEYFNDQNGFRTGIAQKWKEGTLTLAYMPTAHIEFDAELRQDRSNVASFLNSSGVGKDSQTSEGLEAIYKF
ncbi:MAG: outer membrane beta-barrel protein [Burkholderiales bacterium]